VHGSCGGCRRAGPEFPKSCHLRAHRGLRYASSQIWFLSDPKPSDESSTGPSRPAFQPVASYSLLGRAMSGLLDAAAARAGRPAAPFNGSCFNGSWNQKQTIAYFRLSRRGRFEAGPGYRGELTGIMSTHCGAGSSRHGLSNRHPHRHLDGALSFGAVAKANYAAKSLRRSLHRSSATVAPSIRTRSEPQVWVSTEMQTTIAWTG
jgi:hypothetical protein